MTNWNPDMHCEICGTYVHSLRAMDYTTEELLTPVCCDDPTCQKKFTLFLLKKEKTQSRK